MHLFFAWRYLRSKKSTNAINIIAWISMVAIAVVTAALVVVLSVFNGFEDLVKLMYADFYPPIKVSAKSGKWMQLTENQLGDLHKITGIESIEPVIEDRAILVDQEDKSIVWLKGVSSEYGIHNQVSAHMVRGRFSVGDSAEPQIVVGVGVERTLQITAGQSPFPLTVYFANPDASPATDELNAMISANAFAAGSFAIQQEFDDQYAFTHIDFVRFMENIPANRYTALEVFGVDEKNWSRVAEQMQEILGDDFVIKNRYEQNQGLFSAMQTEKLIIYLVAFLILVIAGFNIISSLTMTVLEKQADIAVLKSMGATDHMIKSIFLHLGLLLAGIGALSGFVIGLFICAGQQYFHWVKIAGQSFVINYYPVAVRLSDLLIILALIAIMAFISALIPSGKAVKSYYSLR